jgi:hypothetical protein
MRFDGWYVLSGNRSQSGPESSQTEEFRMEALNSTQTGSLSTNVRVCEAEIIKTYCDDKGIDLDSFMSGLAVADATLGTTIRNEAVLTIIWSSGAFMPPRKAKEDADSLLSLDITWKKWKEYQEARNKTTALTFFLPNNERDFVMHHIAKQGFTNLYHGRLALRAIAIDSKWWDEEEYWRNVNARLEKRNTEFLRKRSRRTIWNRIIDRLF